MRGVHLSLTESAGDRTRSPSRHPSRRNIGRRDGPGAGFKLDDEMAYLER